MVRRLELRRLLGVKGAHAEPLPTTLPEDRLEAPSPKRGGVSSSVQRSLAGGRHLAQLCGLRRIGVALGVGVTSVPLLVGCGAPGTTDAEESPRSEPTEETTTTRGERPAPTIFDRLRDGMPDGHLFAAYLNTLELDDRQVHREAARLLQAAPREEQEAFVRAFTTDIRPWLETRSELAEAVAASMLSWRIELDGMVIDRDFPDPFVLVDQGRAYFYATNSGGMNVPVMDPIGALTDQPQDALPDAMVGEWARTGVSRIWAPAVSELEDGRFALFYSAEVRATGRMAIGVAFADHPNGPFDGRGFGPLVQEGQGPWTAGGAIDATPHRENGTLHLVFKNDGNAVGAATQIWLAALSPDASRLAEPPVSLLGEAGAAPWEVAAYSGRPLIEGPALEGEDGYYLFYSANDWASDDYAVSFAFSEQLRGPYVRSGQQWLRSAGDEVGPGGQQLFTLEDQTYMIHHFWRSDAPGYDVGGIRRAEINRVDLSNIRSPSS